MSKEKRKFERRVLQMELELATPAGDVLKATTRDMSEGGLFIDLARAHQPMIGEVVALTPLDENDPQSQQLPSRDAVVVRQTDSGIGLAFIELDFNDDF
ncbi:MAG TPA: PilZ domain-containing protein [Gammaproteobacteria bacterium]